MKLLTEDTLITCKHKTGKVDIKPTQALVTVKSRRVLVETDPEGKQIHGCDNFGINIKPCQNTLRVKTGYSDLMRIDGQRICLDTITGLTDGTLPGTIFYTVDKPGQELVAEE